MKLFLVLLMISFSAISADIMVVVEPQAVMPESFRKLVSELGIDEYSGLAKVHAGRLIFTGQDSEELKDKCSELPKYLLTVKKDVTMNWSNPKKDVSDYNLYTAVSLSVKQTPNCELIADDRIDGFHAEQKYESINLTRLQGQRIIEQYKKGKCVRGVEFQKRCSMVLTATKTEPIPMHQEEVVKEFMRNLEPSYLE